MNEIDVTQCAVVPIPYWMEVATWAIGTMVCIICVVLLLNAYFAGRKRV